MPKSSIYRRSLWIYQNFQSIVPRDILRSHHSIVIIIIFIIMLALGELLQGLSYIFKIFIIILSFNKE